MQQRLGDAGIRVTVEDHDTRAMAGKAPCHRATEAGSAAGDRDRLPAHVEERAHERCVEVANHNARVAWCDFDEMCFNWFDFIEGHTSECEAAWYVKTGPHPDDRGVDEKRCTCGKATS